MARAPVTEDPEVIAAASSLRANADARGVALKEIHALRKARRNMDEPAPPPPPTDAEKRMLELAATITGEAHDVPRRKSVSREHELTIEVRARDMAEHVLRKRYDTALERAARKRAKEIAPKVRELFHETVTTAFRLWALERRAVAIIDSELAAQGGGALEIVTAGDEVRRQAIFGSPQAPPLHLFVVQSISNTFGRNGILGAGDDPLRELREVALAAGIVSEADIQSAMRNVEKQF